MERKNTNGEEEGKVIKDFTVCLLKTFKKIVSTKGSQHEKEYFLFFWRGLKIVYLYDLNFCNDT